MARKSPLTPHINWRQRLLAVGSLALAVAAVALAAALAGGGAGGTRGTGGTRSSTRGTGRRTATTPARPTSYAVGLRVLRLVDTSRTLTLPNGTTKPRTLLTYVRYPALGTPGETDTPDAPAARAYGPFPLIVFGHGFDKAPALYAPLLQAWAHAGYVVAAPAFPLESPGAPGGPNEADLTNQPADVRFVISSLLTAGGAGTGPLAGLVDPKRIAVAGHSDGGDTALAVAYDPAYRDVRVDAVIVLSGAEIPGAEGFAFPHGGPPLLATQGTADTVNPPSATATFFAAASSPKYLLTLLGAEHVPPYSEPGPQLSTVERVTLAFLAGYLGHDAAALARLPLLGYVPGTATLTADP
jgi:alpha-beta hydrolase superfamily lysophospholipase